ncbi:DEAD/DEAH box helicase, partial [Streptomyces sp. NPDC003016]
REMTRLMQAAGITPHTAQVRSGDAELTRITGARTPSGVPVTIVAPVVERPKRGESSSRGRRGRPARTAHRSVGPVGAPQSRTGATPQRQAPLSRAA